MTGRFETLIYTDCRPGQGLQGSAGLQFQARSSTGASAASSVVQRYLLYEPPARWIAELRPVDAYPASFAHVRADGFFATAAGVYLGREANGSREGNQLTHAVLTRDPADYQGLRPAQLFGAGFWTATPAPTTESAPVELDVKATPYSPVRSRDFVLAQPGGRETLLALVSAIENAGRPGEPRVLFVGDDVPTIVEWLVAGTFLVPRATALSLGFKVLTTDPGRAGVPVVAVAPEFAGAAGRIDNQLGYVVFDIDGQRHTPVPATRSANRWVSLFFTEDPNDVVDALDIAAVSGLESDEAAADLGVAAIMHATPRAEHAEPIVGWLRTGPEQLRNAYAADIAELFAETPGTWPQRVLVLLDAVGCDELIPGRAASVRLALIHSEVAAARERGVVADRRLPSLPDGEWGAEDVNVAKRMLINALNSGVPPAHVDALLRVATRLGIDLRYADFPETAQAFVAHWADHPTSGHDPTRWPCGVELEDLLIDRLAGRVETEVEGAATVGAGWWRWLLQRTDLPVALQATALGAAVRYGGARESFVDRHLAAASGSAAQFAWTVSALWSQTWPTTTELGIVRDRAPDGVTLPQTIFAEFLAHLCGTGPLKLSEMMLCEDLARDGLLRAPKELRAVLADDRAVVEAVDLLQSRSADEHERSQALRQLRRRPSRLLEMRASQVLDGLLRAGDPHGVVEVIQAGPGLAGRYASRLVEALSGRRDGQPEHLAAAALCFGLTLDKIDPERKVVLEALLQWLTRATDAQLKAARDRLANLDKGWRRTWDRLVEETSRSRRRYRLTHPLRTR